MSVDSGRPLHLFEADARRRDTKKKLAKRKNPLDQLQTSLDALGMIPALGNVADLANVGISTARGNLGEAGLSLAAAVPGLGLVSGAGKLAKKAKGIKAGKNVVKEFKPLKAKDAIQVGKGRDVVLAEMKTPSGETFVQPFYKSSGTSDQYGKLREGVWEPFLGYSKGKKWYRKGEQLSPTKKRWVADNVREFEKRGFSKAEANKLGRLGSYANVSKEISRLDEMKYFDKTVYENVGEDLMDTFLKEQGTIIPDFKQGGQVSNKQVFSYLKNV